MFFTMHYERGIRWYEQYFTDYAGQKYAADISPSYLSSRQAPKRIKKHLGNVKLLAILRNPADQIWSLYNLWLTRGYTTKALMSAIKEEQELLNNVLYFKHISNYLKYFDRKDLLILFYENLEPDPSAFLRSLYKFLGIDEVFRDDFFQAQNQSRTPRSGQLDKLVATTGDLLRHLGLISLKTLLNKTGVSDFLKSVNTRHTPKQAMPSDIRYMVNAHVANDKRNLQQLLGRSLSFWQ